MKMTKTFVPALRTLGFVSWVMLCISITCIAQPSITRVPAEGPPTTTILVSGKGFQPSTNLTILFGGRAETFVTTNSTGGFQNATVRVFEDTPPGVKLITAIQKNHEKAQAPFMVRTNWTQYNFNPNHTGFNPYENVLNASNASNLRLAWSFAARAGLLAPPSVAKGVVYVGSIDHNVYALDAATGTKLWNFTTGDEVDSAPAVVNGVVYVGSLDSNVYALDAATGAELWRFATGLGGFSSATVANGVVYIGSSDSSLYALDAKTGTKIWSFATGSAVQSTPALANGVVYVGSNDTTFYAVDAATGTKLWSFSVFLQIDKSPAVLNGVVYFSSGDTLYALDAVIGAELWTFRTKAGNGAGSPSVAHGVVFVSSSDHHLYALDAVTGTERWSFPRGDEVNSVAIANGVIYLAPNEIFAVNANTGSPLWTSSVGLSQKAAPVVANGFVYVSAVDGHVYAFELGGN